MIRWLVIVIIGIASALLCWSLGYTHPLYWSSMVFMAACVILAIILPICWIWEANRKVFLYPEEWIEPELRDDKSPVFKEIESELLQNDQVICQFCGHKNEQLRTKCEKCGADL